MNIIDHIKLPFRKDKELYLELYKILGFLPHNISFYKLALMHKSVAHKNEKGKPVNNERLEFLGDAVLDATGGRFNIFQILGVKQHETTHSKIIAAFLNPRGTHGIKERFLELFLEESFSEQFLIFSFP